MPLRTIAFGLVAGAVLASLSATRTTAEEGGKKWGELFGYPACSVSCGNNQSHPQCTCAGAGGGELEP